MIGVVRASIVVDQMLLDMAGMSEDDDPIRIPRPFSSHEIRDINRLCKKIFSWPPARRRKPSDTQRRRDRRRENNESRSKNEDL
jgi:hypothetical protein